jgi:acetate---CoA ligase (ADP-forming)
VSVPADGARPALSRLLNPASVAVVGATDNAVMAQTVSSIVDADVDVYFVNPKHPSVFSRPTVASLTSIGHPVDAVFSLVSATTTVRIAEEAATLGTGGLVLMAAGFGELGGEGLSLQRRLEQAARASGMAVIGPNGIGYINVGRNLELTSLPRFRRRPGGVSVVSHSGAMLEAFAASAHRAGGAGLNLLISAGNEAVTDLADYVDYLADDDTTRVIALALEKIRRPAAFFAAVAKARRVGKPVVALKIGRSERSRAIARSHTGTVTGDAWVYDVAFRQAGIFSAGDIDELVDRVQFLEQLPREKWSAARGLAVLTGTGGFASLAADLAAAEGVDLPDVERMNRWVAGVVPGVQVANPLDVTGFVVTRPEIWQQVIDSYDASPEFDVVMYLSQFAEWDQRSRRFSDSLAVKAATSAKTYIVSSLAGQAGEWVDEYRAAHGMAVGNGVRGSLRALRTMADFVRSRPDAAVPAPGAVAPVQRLTGWDWVRSGDDVVLGFGAAMGLLQSYGIPVAPYQIVRCLADCEQLKFAGPYAVKLADVAHRTELGAVRLNVAEADVRAMAGELQEIARGQGLPDTVAVQPFVRGFGEAFVGLTGRSELGPLLVFGIGGVAVEVLRRVSGRLAPPSPADVKEMIAEFDDLGIMGGVRGGPAWNAQAIEAVLGRAGHLIASCRDQIESMDVNPLVVTAGGLVAVDATCFAAPQELDI